MALMFRSVLQNAGGAAELIVTCDSEFAGATISCSDGTTTLNKTCPVSSPYEVTFKIPNSGDWTISATVSGTTYSSDPISVDLDYSTVLEYGFNWKRWVDTAQYLDSTDYSTLSDLLADEEALRELCLEHACVDYLCTSAVVNPALTEVIGSDLFAKWVNNSDYALDKMYANAAIKTVMDTADKYGYGEWVITDDTTTPPTWGAKGNVPIMTSNTAPYGAVSGTNNSSTSDFLPWKAFSGTTANDNRANSNTGATWDIIYEFVNPVCVKMFYLYEFQNRVKNFTIDVSDDASTWQNIYTGLLDSTYDQAIKAKTTNNKFCKYVRFHGIDGYNTSGAYGVRQLQFYGRELSVSVPAMATNTTPYGEAIMSAVQSSNYAYYAFDGNSSTYANTQAENGYIGYIFTTPIIANRLHYRSKSGGGWNVITGKVQGYDGTNWADITDVITFASGSVQPQVDKVVDFSNNTAYLGYRLYAITKDTNFSAEELQFYGLDYSEKEFEEGTTKKWLYDHGVELDEIWVTEHVAKLNDCIQILSAVNAYFVASNQVVPSNYKLLKARVGLNASGTCCIREWTTGAFSNFTSANMPNNNALDTTALTQAANVGVLMTASGIFDVAELWLE